MSSHYRDDRPSLLASLDALRRENEDLRAENLALRVLVEPTSGRAPLAHLQGALAATLVLVGALAGAAVFARESRAHVAPRAPSREIALAAIPLPPPVARPPAPLPVPAIASPATDDEPVHALPSPTAMRAALRPVTRALGRCLADAPGPYWLHVQFDPAGAPTAMNFVVRPDETAPALRRCAREAIAPMRLETEPGVVVSYTLRASRGRVRVRRIRAR